MPSNFAAWITEKKAKPLVVKEAPYTSPAENQVVIEVSAVAINPVDPKVQAYGYILERFPNILGEDVAGEIVEIGKGVEHLKVGQRVLGHPASLMTQDPAQGAFQKYVIVPAALVTPIPDSMSFTTAVVLPLGVATASAGLYQQDYLAVQHPSVSPKSTGKALLVWGGSSSVGSCAIQLGKASGYEVIATASKRNIEYCKKLGASVVIDYSGEDVQGEIEKALEGKELAGIFDAISSDDTVKIAVAIASKTGVKLVATTSPMSKQAQTAEVKVNPVFATTIMLNDVGASVFGTFLPEALAQGSFVPKPDPMIVGKGLDKIQEAMDKLLAGVSATKVVVEL